MIVCDVNIANWVFEPHGGSVGSSTNAIGWIQNGKLTGGFAIESCNGVNCFAHIRIDGYVSRKFWFAMVDWVFNQLGCERMTAPVNEINEKSIKMVENVGFTKEATLKKAASTGDDLHFYVLWKENCRILKWSIK